MAIITLPSCPSIVGKNLRYTAPTQVNRSEWTNRRKAVGLSAAPMWSAEVTPFEIDDEAVFWAWNTFFAKLQGRLNTFRLPVVAKSQLTATVLVKGGGQTGYSLLTDGWGAVGLKAGQYVTVADQLMRLTADATPSGGEVTLSLDRWLWAAPADNAVVNVGIPTALMTVTDDSTQIQDDTMPWDPEGEGRWTIGFSCEEAISAT